MESNEGIADTVEQNAVGIGNVAQNTTELADNMREIIHALQEVQEVIDDLTRQAEIFRISEEGGVEALSEIASVEEGMQSEQMADMQDETEEIMEAEESMEE